MGYLGWKNHQTQKTWEEIVRIQDEIIPLVEAERAASPRGLLTRLAKALENHFRLGMPLQDVDVEEGRYVHDYWGSLLYQSFIEIDWRSLSSNLVWQLANPEQHPDVAGRGGRKQDWSARDRLWSTV